MCACVCVCVRAVLAGPLTDVLGDNPAPGRKSQAARKNKKNQKNKPRDTCNCGVACCCPYGRLTPQRLQPPRVRKVHQGDSLPGRSLCEHRVGPTLEQVRANVNAKEKATVLCGGKGVRFDIGGGGRGGVRLTIGWGGGILDNKIFWGYRELGLGVVCFLCFVFVFVYAIIFFFFWG